MDVNDLIHDRRAAPQLGTIDDVKGMNASSGQDWFSAAKAAGTTPGRTVHGGQFFTSSSPAENGRAYSVHKITPSGRIDTPDELGGAMGHPTRSAASRAARKAAGA